MPNRFPNLPEDLATPAEIAKLTGAGYSTIQNGMAAGRYPFVMHGGFRRIPVDAFNEAVESNPWMSHHRGKVTVEKLKELREEDEE